MSDEDRGSTAGARSPIAAGPRRFPQHIAAGARSSSAPTAGSRARFSPDLTRWPAQVVRAPGLEPIFRGRRALHATKSSHLDIGGSRHLAHNHAFCECEQLERVRNGRFGCFLQES